MADIGKTPARLRVLPTEEYFSIVKHQLAASGRAHVRVTGNSMYPLLHHLRDGVLLRTPENIRPGDIVLFDRRNGRYALHRVISVRNGCITMAGDNQWHFERGLSCCQVVGVVTAVIRNGREISTQKISMRIYAQAVRLLCLPRIYLYKALQKFLKRKRNETERMEP